MTENINISISKPNEKKFTEIQLENATIQTANQQI
jgi:hypothetical protein